MRHQPGRHTWGQIPRRNSALPQMIWRFAEGYSPFLRHLRRLVWWRLHRTRREAGQVLLIHRHEPAGKKVIELWTCRKKVIKIFSAMCICEQSSLRFRKTYTWDQSQWKKQPRRKLVKGLLPDERYVHTARLLLSHASVFNITGTNKPWFVRIRSNERSSRELIRSPCPRWWARWTFQSIDALGKNATPFCRGRWDGNTLR